ncbi:MAG: spore coat U domain-containing protein [Polaromonas sp.]|nr:spore coat U domain-containing protein [Polaromonas sp.]
MAVAGFALLPTAAMAATTNTTFTVSVAVPATCLISATALSFVAYTGVVDVATSSISMTCSNTTNYNVGLNAGLASGATVSTRRMSNGANVISYSLYSDPNRTLNWGQTVGTDTITGTGSGTTQVLTVYGRVPAGQFVTPGNYSDTIIATVTY